MKAKVLCHVRKDPLLFPTLIQKNKIEMHLPYFVKIHLDISLQLLSSLASSREILRFSTNTLTYIFIIS